MTPYQRLRNLWAKARRSPAVKRSEPATPRETQARRSPAVKRSEPATPWGLSEHHRAGIAHWSRRVASAVGLFAVTLTGLVIAVQLFAHTSVDVGPFSSTLSVRPTTDGHTQVVIPPLGALQLDSHVGPAKLQVRLDSLDKTRTEALITDPTGITRASATVVEDVRGGVSRLAMRTIAVAMLGAMLLAAVIYRRMSRVAWAGGLAMVITMGSLGMAFATLRPDSIREPRYEGLLANAPAIVGDAQSIALRYDQYAAQLQKLVQNVGNLYSTVASLPVYAPDDGTIRVLHVSDLHLNPSAWSVIRTAVEQFHIDLVVDTGDITDWGSEPEANFVTSIALLGVPYVYVRGNHDSSLTQAAIAAQPNAVVLEDEVKEVAGLRLAGIGDPRFTPDKSVAPAGPGISVPEVDRVIRVGENLAETIAAQGQPVDIALVHDPLSSGPLAGSTPLVLAGHTHNRDVRLLGDTTTRLMVQGSTGGAGLRGLEGEEPTPLAMSVLYFDPAHRLLAYDDIRVGGTGLAEVSLSRHVVDQPLIDPQATTGPDGLPLPAPTG